MARIKSALEIALERTESVKGDKAEIVQFSAKQKGKKLANSYIDGEAESIEDEIKKAPKEEQAGIRQGAVGVFVSRLALPASEDDLALSEKTVKGLVSVFNDSRFSEMAKQLSQILRQYLSEASQYEKAIKQQYAPKLRQKEEEIARRTGRQLKIDPFQDPEFVAFYNQNMNALKSNYQPIIDEFREEIQKIKDYQ